MEDWTVAGRHFRTQGDYEAAKKDAAYIEKLRESYDLDTREGAGSLLQDLRKGKYRFRTILGQDFEEEIQELSRTLAKREETGQKAVSGAGRDRVKKQTGRERTAERKTTAGAKTSAGGKTSAPKGPPRLEDYDSKMQKAIRKEMKKQEWGRRLLVFACMGVAAFCFAYLAYYYYRAEKTDVDYGALAELKEKAPAAQDVKTDAVVIHYDNETIEVPEILDEYKSLYNKNKSLIGWIKIDDTNIDYPVLQAADNEYYLRRNFSQEYDKNGCIFLDKDCDILKRSTNLIVYGHHMSSGKMFGTLDKYSSEDFYRKHKYIQFDTIYEKGRYEVMYVFRSKIYEEDEIVFKYYQFIDVNSETEFDSNMREMSEMALYDTGVTAEYGDELLTLSTCDYYTSYGRFVVVAKRVE